MISEFVPLSSLSIDKNIVFRDFGGNQPFTYAVKIIEMNRERICQLFQLSSFELDHEASGFHLQGERQKLHQAIQRIAAMLREPVFALRVNIEFVVALRVLKDVKKDFSMQTGCWLHFIWVSRTVSCYGVDGTAAKDYVQQVIDGVRMCAASVNGFNGLVVVEKTYDRRYKNLIKKYVDYIESQSGSKLAIKKDDAAVGNILIQFYGFPKDIQEAFKVIDNDILTRAVDEPGPFPATPCPPGTAIPSEQFHARRQQTQPTSSPQSQSQQNQTISSNTPPSPQLPNNQNQNPNFPNQINPMNEVQGRMIYQMGLPPQPPNPIQTIPQPLTNTSLQTALHHHAFKEDVLGDTEDTITPRSDRSITTRSTSADERGHSSSSSSRKDSGPTTDIATALERLRLKHPSYLQLLAQQRGPRYQLAGSASSPALPVSTASLWGPTPPADLLQAWNNVPKPQPNNKSIPRAGSLNAEIAFQQNRENHTKMTKIYKLVDQAGVDTKWTIQLLRVIAESKLDLPELVSFMETQVEVSESKRLDRRLQTMGTMLDEA